VGVVAGCVTPHPPIIVEEVGGAATAGVSATISAMRRLSRMLAEQAPEAVVIMSPHGPQLGSALPVRTEPCLEGSFAAFRAPQVRFRLKTAEDLAERIVRVADREGLPVRKLPAAHLDVAGADECDHGLMVPLYFLGEAVDVPVVSLGMAFLPYDVHYEIGRVVHLAAEEAGTRAIFVASGDLSHRLTPGAPAGYSPHGRELDLAIQEALASQDFERLMRLDPVLVEAGGECGLRSIITLTGCFKDRRARFEQLSYEGPFGVGYLVGYLSTEDGGE